MKRQSIQKLANVVGHEGRRLQGDFYSKDSVQLAKALLGKVLVHALPDGQLLRGTIVETEAYPGTEEAAALDVHCFITKKTDKNAGIFMEAGTTWVYLTYGVFNMINISALLPGSACLVRALEPKASDDHLRLMEKFRLQKKQKMLISAPADSALATRSRKTRSKVRPKVLDGGSLALVGEEANPILGDETDIIVSNSAEVKPKFKFHEIANGPGKLCKALNIEKLTCDQVDLNTSPLLWLEENEEAKFAEGNFEIVEATRIGIGSAPVASQRDLFRFYIMDNLCVSTAKSSKIKKKLTEATDTTEVA